MAQATMAATLPQFDFTDTYRRTPPPNWYADQHKVHSVAIALLVGGGAGMAATLAAAVWLVGTPVFIITSVSIAAAASIALLIAGTVLKLKTEFWQDPAYRCQVAREMVKTIQEEQLSFAVLERRFPKAMQEQVLSDNQLNQLYAQDIDALSYLDFVQRHSVAFLDKLNPSNLQTMRAKFLEMVANSEHGIRPLMQQHRVAIAKFCIGEEELFNQALLQQIDDLQCRDLTYKQFHQNNGREAIEAFIRLNQGVKPIIRESFLNMGWPDMTRADFEADRLLLDIQDQDIYRSVKRDCLDYVPFRRKHTCQPLIEGIIPRDEFPSSWQAEICAYLADQPAATVLAYTADLGLFDLDSRQMLYQRWSEISMSDIFISDRQEFASIYLSSAEGRSHAKERLLNECEANRWSIQQLLQFREMWGRQLLTLEDRFSNGSTIQQRFEQEVQASGSFEELIDIYGSVAIENGLFALPAVQKKIWQVHRAHPLARLPRKVEQILQRFPTLIPQALTNLIQDKQRHRTAAKESFQRSCAAARQTLSQKLAECTGRQNVQKANLVRALHPRRLGYQALDNQRLLLQQIKIRQEAHLSRLRSQLAEPERQADLQRRAHIEQQARLRQRQEASARLPVVERALQQAVAEHAHLSSRPVQGLIAAAQHTSAIRTAQQQVQAYQNERQALQGLLNTAERPLYTPAAPFISERDRRQQIAGIAAAERALRPTIDALQTLTEQLTSEELALQQDEASQLQRIEAVYRQDCEIETRACARTVQIAKDHRRQQQQYIREAFVQALDERC